MGFLPKEFFNTERLGSETQSFFMQSKLENDW